MKLFDDESPERRMEMREYRKAVAERDQLKADLERARAELREWSVAHDEVQRLVSVHEIRADKAECDLAAARAEIERLSLQARYDGLEAEIARTKPAPPDPDLLAALEAAVGGYERIRSRLLMRAIGHDALDRASALAIVEQELELVRADLAKVRRQADT